MRLLTLVLLFFNLMSIQAQNSDFYLLDEALKYPKSVKSLTLNLNFNPIDSIPEGIGILENVEEIIFFPCFVGRVSGGLVRFPPNIKSKYSYFLLPARENALLKYLNL